MMKKLLRTGAFLLGFFFLLTVTGSILVSAYKDDIQRYILKYLNDHLNTEVNVRKISISMLRHFPYISASFRDVTILSSSEYRKAKLSPDTLLSANEVVLDINIYNVLVKKDIKIGRVLVNNGNLALAAAGEDRNNWNILKKNNDPGGRKVNVRLFRLKGINYRYENRKEGFVLKGKLSKGEWSEKIFTGQQGGVRITVRQERGLLDRRGKKEAKIPGPAEVTFLLYSEKDKWQIEKGKIGIGNYPEISFEGSLIRGKGMKAVFDITSGGLEMNEVIPLLTGKKGDGKEVRPGGEISAKGRIRVGGGQPLTWKADLDLTGRDHLLRMKKNFGEVRITSWKGKATVNSSKGKMITKVVLSPVELKYGHSTFTGKVVWENDRQRPVSVSVKGKTDLPDANVLFGGNKIFLKGTADTDVGIKIPLTLLKKQKKGDWKKVGITGTLRLHDFEALLPGHLQGAVATLTLLPGHLLQITGDHIAGAGTRWKIDGKIYHLDDLIEKGTPVVIRGNLRARSADLEAMIGFFSSPGETKAGKEGKEEEQGGKNNPVIMAGFSVDTLRYQEVKISRMKGTLAYHDPVLELKDLSFHSLEGEASGEMKIQFLQGGNVLLSTYGNVEHINVHQLFLSFHDFNQEFIRARNLEGRISGDIAFQALFDSSGRVRPETILSDSYLTLEDGALLNFEPLYKLSKFIRLSELKNIRFSKLENEIFIRDGRVIIPDMKVSSSAVDLDIAGSHYFDKHFEYHIRVYLSDYLARKANKDNGLDLVVAPGERKASLFLIYKGDAESSKIFYDKKRTKQKISEDLKKEKEELKTLFRGDKEGLTKDTMILQEEGGEKSFRVVWPETEEKKDTIRTRGKDTSSGKAFRVIWEEEPDTVPKKGNMYL